MLYVAPFVHHFYTDTARYLLFYTCIICEFMLPCPIVMVENLGVLFILIFNLSSTSGKEISFSLPL